MWILHDHLNLILINLQHNLLNTKPLLHQTLVTKTLTMPEWSPGHQIKLNDYWYLIYSDTCINPNALSKTNLWSNLVLLDTNPSLLFKNLIMNARMGLWCPTALALVMPMEAAMIFMWGYNLNPYKKQENLLQKSNQNMLLAIAHP